MSCIWDPAFRFINRLLLLLLTIRLEGARTTDTDIAEAGQKFLSNPLCALCQTMFLFAFFLRTGTFQHSVTFRHFSGPHNNNKGECRTKHNHQEQRNVTSSFSFSNPLSVLCQTKCFFAAFFCKLELSNILSMLFQNNSLVLTTTARENAWPNIIFKQNSKPRL